MVRQQTAEAELRVGGKTVLRHPQFHLSAERLKVIESNDEIASIIIIPGVMATLRFIKRDGFRNISKVVIESSDDDDVIDQILAHGRCRKKRIWWQRVT